MNLSFTKNKVAFCGLLGLAFLSGCSSVNQPPTVKITAPLEGSLQGSAVAFQSSASDPDGRIATYRWDFGDGTTSEEPQPKHTYAQSGEYRVELVVTDDRGASARHSITIRVQVGPKAVATLRQAHSDPAVLLQHISGETPLAVVFDSSRSMPEPGTKIMRWHWDFGDGEESGEPNPIHIYTRGGQYQPTLIITDDRGRTSQAQLSVQVTSYEAYEGAVELKDATVRYQLYEKATKASSAGPSMSYWYVVETPRKLREGEIRAVLADIIQRAQQRPRITRITVYLFDKIKKNFMIAGDYEHYLGSAIWDKTELPEKALSFSANRAYLLGKAIPVLGYEIREQVLEPDDPECEGLCERYRIGVAQITIQDESVCRGLLLTTIREIARWRLGASYDGFLVQIYSKDGGQPLAWVLGVRGPLTFEQLSVQKLAERPSRWDIQEPSLRVSLGQVPSC